MALIDETTKGMVRKRLAATLAGPVELRLYRRPSSKLILPDGAGCPTCDAAEELARAVAEAAPQRVRFTVVDVDRRPGGTEAVPSLTVARPGEEARITFLGLPAGYEFATLLDALERASGVGDGLAPELVERIAGLDAEVEVMVFVTPGCPYCPRAASLANRMALASPRVRSLVVEASEFPELAERYHVQGVPRTVVNRRGAFVGALSEEMFVDAVLRLAQKEAA